MLRIARKLFPEMRPWEAEERLRRGLAWTVLIIVFLGAIVMGIIFPLLGYALLIITGAVLIVGGIGWALHVLS